MEEKKVIKYVDELINDYIKDPNEEFAISNFLHEHKKHQSERKNQVETSKLEESIEIFGRIKNCLPHTKMDF